MKEKGREDIREEPARKKEGAKRTQESLSQNSLSTGAELAGRAFYLTSRACTVDFVTLTVINNKSSK
jgi:hypothetical protein